VLDTLASRGKRSRGSEKQLCESSEHDGNGGKAMTALTSSSGPARGGHEGGNTGHLKKDVRPSVVSAQG